LDKNIPALIKSVTQILMMSNLVLRFRPIVLTTIAYGLLPPDDEDDLEPPEKEEDLLPLE
jgi:hypothetical protein